MKLGLRERRRRWGRELAVICGLDAQARFGKRVVMGVAGRSNAREAAERSSRGIELGGGGNKARANGVNRTE